MRRKRLYLKAGDKVRHIRFDFWGMGEVVEEKHSFMDGGTCMVRVLFEDGEERSFLNDLDSELCCYYSGLRICDEFSL